MVLRPMMEEKEKIIIELDYSQIEATINHSYDMLGRKTAYNEGLLSERYTYINGEPNIHRLDMKWYNGHTGRQESKWNYYYYDHNQLESITSSDYSNHYNSAGLASVYYSYDRQTGKLKTIEDESGSQHFEYGNMGEVTKMVRVYTLPTPVHPFAIETRFVYDTWGRIDTIVYPDGEIVSYKYNKGGQLFSVQGEKARQPYKPKLRIGKYEFNFLAELAERRREYRKVFFCAFLPGAWKEITF